VPCTVAIAITSSGIQQSARGQSARSLQNSAEDGQALSGDSFAAHQQPDRSVRMIWNNHDYLNTLPNVAEEDLYNNPERRAMPAVAIIQAAGTDGIPVCLSNIIQVSGVSA